MAEPPVRWRLGCFGWICVLLGFLAAIVLTGMCWVRTTSDLDDEVARAKALGVPMTWAELGLDRKMGPDAEILARIGKVAERAKDYTGDDSYELQIPFYPVPPALVAWQQAGGSGIDAELDALIDQLSGNPVWGVDQAQLSKALDDVDTSTVKSLLPLRDGLYSVDYVLLLRSAAGIDEPRRLLERYVLLISTPSSPLQPSVWRTLAQTRSFVSHILRHRERLPAGETAAQIQKLVLTLDTRLPLAIASQPVYFATVFRLPGEHLAKSWAITLPYIMANRLSLEFFYRCGRAPILARAIDTASWLRINGIPTTFAKVGLAAPELPVPSLLSIPRNLLTMTMDSAGCSCFSHPAPTTVMHHQLSEHLRITTYLRLLAADLEGTPWPIDPGDPAGGRLREIRRGGKLIGAYSVGPDGRDDGGSRETDWCLALREKLGSPMASDPPAKR